MRKAALLLAVFVLSAGGALGAVGGALAATGAEAPVQSQGRAQRIALIDVQRILQESSVSKAVQQQIEASRAKFQSETAVEETELREAEKELARARDSLTTDEFANREQALRQRFLAVERHVQARRRALEQATTDSTNVIRKTVHDIVDALARSGGYDFVILKQQVFWSGSDADLTDGVLAALQKKLPSLEVNVTVQEEPEKEKSEPVRTNPRQRKR